MLENTDILILIMLFWRFILQIKKIMFGKYCEAWLMNNPKFLEEEFPTSDTISPVTFNDSAPNTSVENWLDQSIIPLYSFHILLYQHHKILINH